MTYNHDTGERYSNDNHPEFPHGMKFILNDIYYGIYRTDDINNWITVMSKGGGHQYITLDNLRKLFEEGKAVKIEEDDEEEKRMGSALLKYRLPNRKKWLLTDQFLQDFKDELDKIFPVDENSNYWNHYNWFEGTGGFYKALKTTSEKHNVYNAIYLYAQRMPWYHSDLFDYELVKLMKDKEIITEGSIEDIDSTEGFLVELIAKGEAQWVYEVTQYNGYSVTKRDWDFIEEDKNEAKV